MEIRIAQPSDFDLLASVDDGLFDNPIDPHQLRRFLADPNHHLAMGLIGKRIVSFASATGVLHPDKPPALFINEVATRTEYQRKGYARAVTQALITHARGLGYKGIWLATEPENDAARALYRGLNGQEDAVIVYSWDNALP